MCSLRLWGVAAVSLWAAPALAQPAEVDPVSAQPGACEARDPTTAEINSREGVRLAKAGKFDEAVALFRIAVRLDACAPEHELLLARGLSRQAHFEDARAAYRRVIDGFPGTPSAARGVQELSEMEITAREAALPPMPPPAEPPPATPPSRPPPPALPWRPLGYATAGVGALGLALGLYYGLDAQDADDALNAAAKVDDRPRYDRLVDQRSSSSTLAWTFYGVGTALVVGGAVMAFALPDAGATTGAQMEAPVGLGLDAAGGLSVLARGHF